MYKKALCTSKVVVLLNKPIAFLTSSLPLPSSLLKLPYDFNEFSLKSFKKKINVLQRWKECCFFFNAITLRKFVKSSPGVVVAVTVVEFLWHIFSYTRGRKGWRSSESTRLPPMWLGFKSRRRRHNAGWVCCWFSLLFREVFLRVLRFFSFSSKTNISKFQFDQDSGRRRTTMWMCDLQIVIYLFIYLW